MEVGQLVSSGREEDCSGCIFCSKDARERPIANWGTVFAIEDKYPVTKGHMLIIPVRHTDDYFSMTREERIHADELLRILKEKILQEDRGVTGFNVGINCGESAGQTVMHAHVHLIPRRDGDTPCPRGGVRGVVPHKMNY